MSAQGGYKPTFFNIINKMVGLHPPYEERTYPRRPPKSVVRGKTRVPVKYSGCLSIHDKI